MEPMKYLSEEYQAIYTHKGYNICTRKIACPGKGEPLGYYIDSDQFAGKEYNDPADAIGAIDAKKNNA